MQAVPSQSNCSALETSSVREEIGLRILCSPAPCNHWCSVNHYLVLSDPLCFSIICIKAERFPQPFVLPVCWFPWVLMEIYPIFSSVFQNKFWFTQLFTHATMHKTQELSFVRTSDVVKIRAMLNLGCQRFWPVSGPPYSKMLTQQNLLYLPH